MNKKTKTTFLVILIFVLLVFSLFVSDIVPKELFDEYFIFIYAGIGIAIIFLIILIIYISKKRNSPKLVKKENKIKTKEPLEKEDENEKKEEDNKKELERKRENIISELKSLENQFLKNKISKDAFNKSSSDKNAELIRIEAQIDAKKKINMSIIDAKALEEISSDKKNVLKGLLDEKQRKVYELGLTEKSFLKRKIDESTYKKISDDVKTEIISIEEKIKSLQKSDEIEKIKRDLLEGAKEISKQQKNTKKRVEEQPKTFEDQVFEQIGFN